MIRVLAVDPGVTSGYTYAVIEPKVDCKFFVAQRTDDVDDFWRLLKDASPNVIVIENFEFRQGRQRTGINLFPKELIGVARLYSMLVEGCGIYIQSAATGKSYYSDRVLSGLGLIKYGDKTKLGHGLDSMRHFLQWLSFGAGTQLTLGKGRITDFATRLEEWPKDS